MELPIFLWLIILPLGAAPLIYLSGHVGTRRIAQATALLVLLITWIPFSLTAIELQSTDSISFTYGGITLSLDGLGLLLTAVALGLGTMVVIFSGPYMSHEDNQDKFYAMLSAMVGVMIGLGLTNDLFNLWIWFEAMAITSYLLVTFYREQPLSLEAGVKYLIQSAAGSVLVLLGIGFVLSQTGTLNLTEIRQAESSPWLLVAGVAFILGFGVKTALVPLHTWLPDAHSMAPSGISAMLSGVVIEAGLVAMLRSLGALSAVSAWWGIILMIFGILNMLLGNLMALRQKQVKRLLAYSSLVHVGYMLVGLGVAIRLGIVNGAQGGVFHLLNHGIMKGLAFLAAGCLLYTLHIASGNHNPLTTSDLNGAAKRYPLVAFAFSLAVLGLGGIPPLAGFMSKWQIFVSGFEANDIWIEILVLFAAVNSVFSLVYYAPMINALYRLQPSDTVSKGKNLPGMMNIPLIILAVLVMVIGIWPGLMNWLTVPAGTALVNMF